MRRYTDITNQLRGIFIEHYIALAQGEVAINHTQPWVLEIAIQQLADMLRDLIDEQLREWYQLGKRINVLTSRLESAANGEKTVGRLMSAG
ncbi:hypothetical protein [Pseudomonas sp. GD03696]|uniref:hypothetical protein n=1 Tax=Pseudomonas sp. GD03696 TaxID=2975368 RepID=UPI00244786F0|nr:hypothetical protein [Pseudomonas sp. GD03696]MDH1932689.1 hypothetical protein [Pseudomonas sp. GD03696]